MAIHADSCQAHMKVYTRDFLVSFETGEQVTGLQIFPPPVDGDSVLVGGNYEVVKALAGTDAGTIDLKDASGNTVITQASIPLSSALGTRGTLTVSTITARINVGPNQVTAYHAITTAKTTAGGKVLLSLHYRRLRPGRLV